MVLTLQSTLHNTSLQILGLLCSFCATWNIEEFSDSERACTKQWQRMKQLNIKWTCSTKGWISLPINNGRNKVFACCWIIYWVETVLKTILNGMKSNRASSVKSSFHEAYRNTRKLKSQLISKYQHRNNKCPTWQANIFQGHFQNMRRQIIPTSEPI